MYLTRIRPAYLALGKRTGGSSSVGSASVGVPLTDKQRDEIDYETKLILQQTMLRIRSLEDLETQRLARESNGGTGGMLSGFAGLFVDVREETQRKTVKTHRQAILWYLNDRLKDVSARHSAQQEVRLGRQTQKSKSKIHNVSEIGESTTRNNSSLTAQLESKRKTNAYTDPTAHDALPEALRDLTQTQLTQLENENSTLLDELDVSLSKAKAAEKSLYEISSIQTQLAQHLSTQTEMIQDLMADADQVQDDIEGANKQLESAKARNKKASKIIIYTSLGFAGLLLFYDAITG